MLQMVRNITLSLGALLLFNSCESHDLKGFLFPTGPGVEKRFEQSMDMTSGQPVATLQTSEEYEIYVCTDPHIDKTSRNLCRFNDDLRNDANASFGVILGDCTDRRDNLKAYLNAIRHSEEKHIYNYPLFHLVGNHDVQFNGWEEFRTHIGPSVYRFETRFTDGADLFIALDSGTGTLGRQQISWLRSLLAKERDKYRHCIILTHTHLFYTDKSQGMSGNMSMEETMALTDLFNRHRVTLVLQGHAHYRKDLTYGHVRYTTLGAIADKTASPEYLKIRISQKDTRYEWIRLRHAGNNP